jgi:hypothetical protein
VLCGRFRGSDIRSNPLLHGSLPPRETSLDGVAATDGRCRKIVGNRAPDAARARMPAHLSPPCHCTDRRYLVRSRPKRSRSGGLVIVTCAKAPERRRGGGPSRVPSSPPLDGTLAHGSPQLLRQVASAFLHSSLRGIALKAPKIEGTWGSKPGCSFSEVRTTQAMTSRWSRPVSPIGAMCSQSLAHVVDDWRSIAAVSCADIASA